MAFQPPCPPFLGRGREPHGERLGEVLVGVRLGVPVGQVLHEAAAVRPRAVGLRLVLGVRVTEHGAPLSARREPIGVVEGVPALVSQELRAPLRRAALDLHHLVQLELLQAGMREIEGDGDGRDTIRAEPLVAQVTGGPQEQPARFELAVEPGDARFELAALDANAEVTDAKAQKLFVAQGGPGGIWQRVKESTCSWPRLAVALASGAAGL